MGRWEKSAVVIHSILANEWYASHTKTGYLVAVSRKKRTDRSRVEIVTTQKWVVIDGDVF